MEYAYEYARYSSDKQDEASIDAQFRAIREYAAAHDIQIIGSYADEAVSGKGSATARRREYQRLLRDIQKRQVTLVLVHKYDRVARNVGEHVNLEMKLQEAGCRLIAVGQELGTGSESKIIKTLLWAMSEYYIDNLASETRKGMKETALKGLHTGGVPPFGYDVVEQRYVINELEAFYVRRMFDAAETGAPMEPLLKEMEAAGIRGKRGAVIRYPQAYEILRNEKYTGLFTYTLEEEKSRDARRDKLNAIRIDGAVPAIITKEQFQAVQNIMKGRKRVGKKADYLCSGLVYCSCGAKMHVYTATRKGHTYSRYVCSKHCGEKTIRVELVDAAAMAYLREILDPEMQKRVKDAMRQYQDGAEDRHAEFKAALAARIREKKKEHANLLQNLSTGALPPSVVKSVGERMQALETEISTLEATQPPEDYSMDHVRAWMESIKAAPDEKAVRLLVERIEIKNATVSNIHSTLETVVGNHGCGGAIAILPAKIIRWRIG